MNPEVKLLDQNTSNQIAAGEVVEKPASVIKELVENSLDAGATSIDVTIYEGGSEFMRVVDNGIGMTEDNARLAVLRHATSKIRKAEDLLSLNTLGFRGEALPSIASVSNFSLVTRPTEQEFATSITIDGGENMEVGEAGGTVGTTITVKNLFFNVPARRKFLRTVSTEGRYINDIISKIALSRPDVRFTLLNNDKEVVKTPGSGDLLDAIGALYGKKVAEETLPVEFQGEEIKVTGYIGKPTLLKGNRSWQTVFVNGRTINSRMISKAIDHAYQSQIPKAGFPFAVLNITLDTSTIDINVHPQKSEIKFGDESAVYRAVYHGLCDALTKPLSGALPGANSPSGISFRVGGEEERSGEFGGSTGTTSYGTSSSSSSYGSSSYGSRGAASSYPSPQQSIWKTPEGTLSSYEATGKSILDAQRVTTPEEEMAAFGAIPTTNFSRGELGGEASGPNASFAGANSAESIYVGDVNTGVATIWPLGQVGKTFIIAQSEDALYLIDQHAAHERIMYDRFIRRKEEIPTQEFLVPIFIEVPKDEIQLVEEQREVFVGLGVDVEPAGENLLRVSALPTDVKNENAEDFIKDIMHYLEEGKKVTANDLREEVLHYAACHSAIRAGELLTIRQMRQVILELLNTEHPFTCPHGRPCMVEVSMDELFKMFKRT